MSWNEIPMHRGSRRFQTTHWSRVRQATRPDSGGRQALEELCARYWPPLYAFARHRGCDAEQARDRTQSFFVELLDSPTLARADASRGRFRTYLLTCFQRHLGRVHASENARKRGGQHRTFSLDTADEEASWQAAAAHGATPEKAFERRWAVALIDAAIARLEQEFAGRGRIEHFRVLAGHLDPSAQAPSHAVAAAQLQTTTGAIKVTVHRMRERLAELLLEELGATVTDEVDPREELHELMQALREEKPAGGA